MSTLKTPANVTEAIRKLDASDQVAIQTYIAKLKTTIQDYETEILQLKDGDPHAHYHGHEKCTSDHSHGHDHDVSSSAGGCTLDHDHDHSVGGSGGHDHGHGHSHGHEHEHEHGHGHEHEHEHGHGHDDKKDDDIPAWKKKAMNADPNAAPFGGSWTTESSLDATKTIPETPSSTPDLPPMYAGDGSNDDFDKAAEAKMAAADLKSSGNYTEALEKYTEAILAADPSPLLLANRAHCLFQLENYPAAIRDCDAALEKNPDSAKSLRIRGECYLKTGEYRLAREDLSASQAIDFDEEAAAMLKEATEKCAEMEKEKVKERLEEEEKLKKRAEEIRRAQEEARREAEEEANERARQSGAGAARGMPGFGGMSGGMGGMPGGMGGMEGMMAGLMSDPEIAAGMQNPKIQKAFTDLMSGPGGPMGLMSNPSKLQEMMADPEVGPFLQKLMGKVMGGGMAGMGGMPGMGGMGGMGGGMGDGGDMPDIHGDDDMPDLVD